MSLQQILTDPGALRKALFLLAAAAAAAAFILKRIREKRSGEPRVIRLTLDETGSAADSNVQPAPVPSPDVLRSPEPVEAAPITFAAETAAAPAVSETSPQGEVHTAVATSDLPEIAAVETAPVETAPQEVPEGFIPSEEPVPVEVSAASYSFLTLQARNPVLMDILRGALIMLAIIATGAIVLTALPQPAVDRIAAALRPRNAPGPPPEKIAFLYLGDEVKDNQFHIRGVVRNISNQPIEQLEATVRIYAPDHTLLENQVVRMDSETIFPNATASFHLSFPDYHGQFGSYSLDFKLAQGDPVLYKDMRDTRAGS